MLDEGQIILRCDASILKHMPGTEQYHTALSIKQLLTEKAATVASQSARIAALETAVEEHNEEWLAVLAERDARIAALTEALAQGAAWFEEYAVEHYNKGAIDKAERNESRAKTLRAALSQPAPGSAQEQE